MRINPPLVALAIGAFGIGVTEFSPMGMLPGIAADLGVSIPAAGLLVSAYALGVLLGHLAGCAHVAGGQGAEFVHDQRHGHLGIHNQTDL